MLEILVCEVEVLGNTLRIVRQGVHPSLDRSAQRESPWQGCFTLQLPSLSRCSNGDSTMSQAKHSYPAFPGGNQQLLRSQFPRSTFTRISLVSLLLLRAIITC
jgi:hypothetical protein